MANENEFFKLLEEEEKKGDKKSKKGKKKNPNAEDADANITIGYKGSLSSSVDLCMPTGLVSLDLILAKDKQGVYGIPCGKQMEICGEESVGKSTWLYQVAVAWQKYWENGVVMFVETEGSLDWSRMASFGVDVSNVIHCQPNFIEGGYKAVRRALKVARDSGYRILVIWDSIGMANSKQAYEADDEGVTVSSNARAIANGIRNITTLVSKTGSTIIYVNHLIAKIGGMGWGPKTDTGGGRKIKLACSIRMKFARVGQYKSGDEDLGILVNITTIKNKLAIPRRTVEELCLDYVHGFNKDRSLLQACVASRLAKKKTGGLLTFKISGEKHSVKISGFEEWLKENKGMRKSLKAAVLSRGA